MKKTHLLLISAITLAGCAASPTKTPSALKSEGKAQVLDVTVHFMASTFSPLGAKTNLSFMSVNGQKVGDFWDQPGLLELDEGKHTLDLKCYGTIDNSLHFGYDIKDYEINVKAGRIYQFEASFRQGGCDVAYKDVTNSTQQSN